MKLLLLLALIMVVPVSAQDILDHFRANLATWEKSIESGSGASVRKSVEAFIHRETLAVNPYDYNAMRAVVGTLDIAAKACVVDGSWEDAVNFLKKSHQIATDNMFNADYTFSKLLTQHNKKIKEWQEEIVKQEKHIQNLGSNETSTTVDQQRSREKIQSFLDDHQKAIRYSERSIKEISSLLASLKVEKETHANALSNWQTLLTKERVDIVKVGTVTAYVVEKLKQIKSDTQMLHSERVPHVRRLLRLDPSNSECRRYSDGLTGKLPANHATKSNKTSKHHSFRVKK